MDVADVAKHPDPGLELAVAAAVGLPKMSRSAGVDVHHCRLCLSVLMAAMMTFALSGLFFAKSLNELSEWSTIVSCSSP